MQLPVDDLENAFVRLERMSEAHREDFRAACQADTETWKALYPFSWAGEHFDASWERQMAMNASGQFISFAVVRGGRCVGASSYLNISVPDARVEIGATYYHPDHRGGPVNPAAKRLMLGGAFDAGARRVELRVDAINARSRAAVLKLGAIQEGILRQDRVTWTGRIRDTVIYSILSDEWPAVRDRLDARLKDFAS